jgi:hypothetical protein
MPWLAAVLGLFALVEAFVIAGLLQGRAAPPPPPVAEATEIHLETPDPGASVLVDGKSVGVTPLQLKIGADTRSISVVAAATKPEFAVGSTGQQTLLAENRRDAARGPSRPGENPVTPPPQRSGGLRLQSPIELEVFEGDTRLGSTSTGIVSASAGIHEFDLVNSLLGYRSRQRVEIRGGQVSSVTVTPPNGRININASPWAEVLIDGKGVGETPIGNFSLPLGEHEIVFRHPEFPEQRKTVLVRLDSIARVSANFQR